MTTIALDTQTQKAQARSVVYAYLSLALLYPDEGTLNALREGQGALEAALETLHAPGLRQATEEAVHALEGHDASSLAADHERLLGLASGCLPYESEYDQAHIFQKSQQLADIVAFYRAFELELAPDLKDRADHLGVELEFMHVLAAKEAYAQVHGHGAEKVAVCRDAQRAFLEAHLGAWGPSFAQRLAEADPQGPYGVLARFLGSFLTIEVASFTLATPKPLELLEEEMEADSACETCPLVTGAGM